MDLALTSLIRVDDNLTLLLIFVIEIAVLCFQIKSFKDYVDLFIKDKVDDMGAPLKMVHEKVNERWEVAVTLSDKGFQQMSFVNAIATTKV